MRYAQPALAFVALLALTACDALTDPPNRAPTAGQIPLQTVHVGERRSLDLSGYFADPDGDALTFTAESGHPGLLSVSVSGSTLELAALRQGAATVKVTATDPDGLAASSHMDVVIPNRAPVVMATVADQRLPGPGRTVEVDVSGVFADPDGDALTIEAESGDTSVVAVAVSGFTLTLAASGTGGETRVTLTATDPDGLAASMGFVVAVNRAPAVTAGIPSQTVVAEGPALAVDLSGQFTDPDGDPLTFEASSSDTSAIAVSVSAAVLTVSAVGVRDAEAEVTVTARDPDGLADAASFGVEARENPDRATLEAFWHATQGRQYGGCGDWCWSNWMTDAHLADWYSVEMNEVGRVSCLGRCNGLEVLGGSQIMHPDSTHLLYAPIPPVVGQLQALEALQLHASGQIPPELGNLVALERLNLSDISGQIPPELGNLGALKHLELSGTFGPIRPELGDLGALESLALFGAFGPIPPELGNLVNLRHLWFGSQWWDSPGDQGVSGHIPPELGNMRALESLSFHNTDLSGPVPSELRRLTALTSASFRRPGELCADPTMRAWLEDRDADVTEIALCDAGMAGAYLMQAVQSRGSPVPLVAGEDALLRVFTLSAPIVGRFYLDGAEVHVAEIPRVLFDAGEAQGDGENLPANAIIPGSSVRPGLEMVVEGEGGRVPTEGRMPIDVREMPVLDLTLVPFAGERQGEMDGRWGVIADSMAVDRDHWRLRYTADLLPVGAMQVTVHATIDMDTARGYSVLSIVSAVRALEGGTGHWMGLHTTVSNVAGQAYLGGAISFSIGAPGVIAHELGHNFNLAHAPCGSPSFLDADYPYPDGSIGGAEGVVRGFVFREMPDYWGDPDVRGLRYATVLVDPGDPDLMSYCRPAWISDYHFKKALDYRLQSEGPEARVARDPVRSLLLWGGADSTGTPYLEPVFVVDAPPSLPGAGGPWTLEGRDASGSVLFSLPFAMPMIADASEGAGGFAYTLPVGLGWEALASVTLSGPGGTATLDANTNLPMAIWRDADGQVRAILRRAPALGADGVPAGLAGLSLTFSRGIPDAGEQRP